MNVDEKELVVVRKQTAAAVEAANALAITNAEELTNATDVLSKIKTVQKMVKEKKETITKPINQALKEIRALFAPIEQSSEEAERIVKGKMLAFQQERERKAKEEERKVMERVERGTMKPETAMRKIENIAPPATQVQGAQGAVQFRIVKEVVIVDAALIPREYLIPDMVAIRRAALAGVEIAGVKVEERKQVAAR